MLEQVIQENTVAIRELIAALAGTKALQSDAKVAAVRTRGQKAVKEAQEQLQALQAEEPPFEPSTNGPEAVVHPFRPEPPKEAPAPVVQQPATPAVEHRIHPDGTVHSVEPTSIKAHKYAAVEQLGKEFMQAKGIPAFKELLKEFGVAKAPELPEAKYEAFKARGRQLLGAA
jgi:hypothetical protein